MLQVFPSKYFLKRVRVEVERVQHEEEQRQQKRKVELERKQRELPPAPCADAKGTSIWSIALNSFLDVSSVVVRLPNGNRLVRKFNKTDLLRV